MVENASTIVGESILINGNLSGDEDLTVLGRVHGNINLTKTLVVEESGIVKADVSVRNLIISGVVVGNISASDSVEILEAGRIVGDIKAPRVIITDGARFRGNIDMGDLEAPRASEPLPVRTVERSSLTRTTTRPVSTPVRSIGSPSASRPPVRPTTPVPVPERRAPPPPPMDMTRRTETQPKRPVVGKKKIKKKVVAKKRR